LCMELLTKSSDLVSELFLQDIPKEEYIHNLLEDAPMGNNKLLKKIQERIEHLLKSDESKKVFSERYNISDMDDLVERVKRCEFVSSQCLAMIYYHDEQFRNFNVTEPFLLRSLVMKPNDERGLLMLASLYEYMGNVEMSERVYMLLVHYNPNDPDVLGDVALFFRNVKQDHGRARDLFLQALSIKGDHVNNLRNYAMFLFEEESNVEDALKLLEQAMGIVPNDYMTMSSYGMVLMVQAVNTPATSSAIFKQAREFLKKSLQTNPYQSCAIIMNYAVAERMCGNKMDARKAFDEAIKAFDEQECKQPNDSHVNMFNNYASFLFEEESYEMARNMFQRGLAIDETASAIHCNLALTFVKLGDVKSAEKHFSLAAEPQPDEDLLTQKNNLYQYAKFAKKHLKDGEKAGKLYSRLLKVCEEDGGKSNKENAMYYEKADKYVKSQ